VWRTPASSSACASDEAPASRQRPDVEEQLRRQASDLALASARITPRARITVLLSNGTKLAAEVKKFSPPLYVDSANQPLRDSGRDLALLRVKDGVYPAIGLTTREVQIGDPVRILGFPGVVVTHELLNRSATLEASVTNGAVSGIKQDAINQDLVQTDAPASFGNSGGPAIGDDSRLVGVMTFVSLSPAGGAIVQGFNFLIPARDVGRFLQGTEVKAGDSPFNAVWAAGIAALREGRYARAVAKIGEANTMLSGLSDVKRLLADAEDKVKNPPPRPFPWAWATLGVTLVSAGAYGGMWGQRWWKNRFRVHPTQVIAFIENGLSPVLLDVRTKADYETSPLKLPGSLRLDPEEAERAPLNLEPQQLIVAYCTSPDEACAARVSHALRARGFRKPDNNCEPALPLDKGPGHFAGHRRLDRLVHVGHVYPVARNSVPVDDNSTSQDGPPVEILPTDNDFLNEDSALSVPILDPIENFQPPQARANFNLNRSSPDINLAFEEKSKYWKWLSELYMDCVAESSNGRERCERIKKDMEALQRQIQNIRESNRAKKTQNA